MPTVGRRSKVEGRIVEGRVKKVILCFSLSPLLRIRFEVCGKMQIQFKLGWNAGGVSALRTGESHPSDLALGEFEFSLKLPLTATLKHYKNPVLNTIPKSR